jgi:hypothetical protein
VPDIGSLLDRLQGIFGRGFIVAGVIPVLIAVGTSVAIGYVEVITIRDAVLWLVALSGWRLAFTTAIATFAVVLLGFVYWSVNPWLRGLLEGASFPSGALLRRELRTVQLAQFADVEGRLKAARSEYLDYQELDPDPSDPRSTGPDTWRTVLNRAAQIGNTQLTEAALSALTKQQLSELEESRTRLRPIPSAQVSACIKSLASDRESGKQSSEVTNAIFYMRASVIPHAKRMAEIAFFDALSDRYERFPLQFAAIGYTAFGNISEVQREYASTRYGINADLFGPHFLKAAASDKDFAALLDDAKLKVDFAVAMTVMFPMLTTAWTLTIAICGRAAPVGLVVALLGPLFTIAFYQTAVVSQRGMLSVTRALIDLFRFDVLKELHLPLPGDDETERQTWEAMVGRAQHTSAAHMTYEHS